MAKKKTSDEKKPKQKRPDFTDFIKCIIAPIIIREMSKMKEICEKYSGLDEMDIESWKYFNSILVECWNESVKYEEDTGYIVNPSEILKRASPYTLSHKVREMQRKEYILHHIEKIEQTQDIDKRIYHAYLIYSHISIFIGENAQPMKEVKKKNDPD